MSLILQRRRRKGNLELSHVSFQRRRRIRRIRLDLSSSPSLSRSLALSHTHSFSLSRLPSLSSPSQYVHLTDSFLYLLSLSLSLSLTHRRISLFTVNWTNQSKSWTHTAEEATLKEEREGSVLSSKLITQSHTMSERREGEREEGKRVSLS